MPVQSVTAAHVLSPAAPASLWQWLGQLPDPRDPRGVRFTLPCVIAISIAARLAGCDSFTAAGEWAASRPQRVLKALGCPQHKRAGIRVAPSEKTIRRVAGLIDHDLADDLLCGHAAGLAAATVVLSPAQLQEQRRDTARKARAKARKARDKARKAARKARAVRGRSQKQARKAARRERKAAAAAIAGGRARLPACSAFGRVPVPAGHPALAAAAYGDPRHVPALRGLGADGKASRGAKVKGQEAPQHLGFFWHGTRLNAAQRAVDRKTNETTVIGPVIDGMDLRGVCLTVDALHSLVDLNKRVLAAAGTSSSSSRAISPAPTRPWTTSPGSRSPSPRHLRSRPRSRRDPHHPGLRRARRTEVPRHAASRPHRAVHHPQRQERHGRHPQRDRADPDHRQPGSAPPADLLALNRGHRAATEATHWVRDTDLKEDSSRARAPGAARFMATVGNTVLNLLRIHGVTNIAAERRRLNGSDRKILKRMGLSTG